MYGLVPACEENALVHGLGYIWMGEGRLESGGKGNPHHIESIKSRDVVDAANSDGGRQPAGSRWHVVMVVSVDRVSR